MLRNGIVRFCLLPARIDRGGLVQSTQNIIGFAKQERAGLFKRQQNIALAIGMHGINRTTLTRVKSGEQAIGFGTCGINHSGGLITSLGLCIALQPLVNRSQIDARQRIVGLFGNRFFKGLDGRFIFALRRQNIAQIPQPIRTVA